MKTTTAQINIAYMLRSNGSFIGKNNSPRKMENNLFKPGALTAVAITVIFYSLSSARNGFKYEKKGNNKD